MSSQDDIYEKDNNLVEIICELIETENLSGLFGTLKELEELSHEQFVFLTLTAFKRLLWNQRIDEALHIFDLFPFLCFCDTYIEQMIVDYLFEVASRGEIKLLKQIIDSFGTPVNVLNSSKCNLFEQASYAGQYEMMRVLKEEFGLTSDESCLLERAAKLDRADILEYLWREVGINPGRGEMLIKAAVKGESIESLSFIRFGMGITDYREQATLELALRNAAIQGSIEVLEFLITYFRMLFNPKKILPWGETEPAPKSCLVNTFVRAAHNGNAEFCRYCFYIVKLDFATNDPNSEWASYLRLLQIAVKKGDLILLRCLIEELGIDMKLLPDFQQDSLIFTILKRPGDKKTKKILLDYAFDFESKENIKCFKCMLDPDELKLLAKVKHMKNSGYWYKKLKNDM
ncbi:unnamed protein product [Blepharisma stoltei]|uniref:Uncharacterized protein n=1 Tax=Blepharisma stoltei TaxID=1481888 RepID=A0AAU9IF43_9CILI|nr:unnamed protein product [Blepharisma stoltei]